MFVLPCAAKGKERLGNGDPWPPPRALLHTAYLDEWLTSDPSSSRGPGSARVKPGGFQEPIGPFRSTWRLNSLHFRTKHALLFN